MGVLLTFFFIFFLLSSFMGLLALITGKKSFKDREKMSSFECGFESISKNHMPFSIRFFLVTVIFLIFDVEIALLLPMGIIMKMSDLLLIYITSLILMVILIFGLIHEWNQGALNWVN